MLKIKNALDLDLLRRRPKKKLIVTDEIRRMT